MAMPINQITRAATQVADNAAGAARVARDAGSNIEPRSITRAQERELDFTVGLIAIPVGAVIGSGVELTSRYASGHDFSKPSEEGSTSTLVTRIAGGAALLSGIMLNGGYESTRWLPRAGMGVGMLGASLLVTPSLLRLAAD